MKIVNVSKDRTLAQNALMADSSLKRIVGLIGKTGLKKDEALIIRSCNSIHTFFMRFPIDVLFVDSGNKVVFLRGRLKPWRLTPICWKAKFVIELPAGTIEESKTSLGDEIRLQ